MTGPTHLIVANSISLAAGLTSPFSIIMTTVSSLLPDIDRKDTLLGRCIPFLPGFLEAVFGKRTVTHSLWVFGGLSLLVWLILPGLLLEFLIGYGSHLLLDVFTGHIYLLYPIPVNFGIYLGFPPIFLETAILIGYGIFVGYYLHENINKIEIFAQQFF